MRLSLLLIILFSKITFAQNLNKSERVCSDTLPKKFILDKDKLREHIFKGIPYSIRTGEYSRRALNFAHTNACRVSDFISSGIVYSDWDELETYLNNILQKVMPPELKNDSVIHAYVVRDGSYNAGMAATGHIFVNIGLLAEVPDEATIAGILSHELGHYYFKHSLYSFLAEEAGEFDGGIFATGRPESKFSVKNETQADSVAAVWLQKSGYNLEGLVSAFKTMNRIDRNYIKQLPGEWTLKETTHPLSEKRLATLYDFYNKSKEHLGKNFLVDEALFYKLKEEVKPEILKSLLNDFSYNDCIQNAFKYHLFDPDNSTYIYYIMEGIRRKCYMNSEVWKELFITNMYYDSTFENGERHKEKMTDNLFKKFDLDIITIDPRDGMKLKARFYWKGQPKFTTYEGAYTFFFNLSQALNCHECLLSNALSYTADIDSASRNKYLLSYLSFDDIRQKDFAKNLYNGTLTKCLKNDKITAFNEPNTLIEQGYEKIPLPDKNNLFMVVMDSCMNKNTNRVPLYLPFYKKDNINDYRAFIALQDFSFEVLISKGEKTELHILDPKYWEMFHKYNVNEIEFVNYRYYEVRQKETSIKEHQKIIDTDYSYILSKNTSLKYMDVLITSVREIDNSIMKIRSVSVNNKLNSKTASIDQMAALISSEIALKETRAIEADKKFRYHNNR